jgi:hypothetical protein
MPTAHDQTAIAVAAAIARQQLLPERRRTDYGFKIIAT